MDGFLVFIRDHNLIYGCRLVVVVVDVTSAAGYSEGADPPNRVVEPVVVVVTAPPVKVGVVEGADDAPVTVRRLFWSRHWCCRCHMNQSLIWIFWLLYELQLGT